MTCDLRVRRGLTKSKGFEKNLEFIFGRCDSEREGVDTQRQVNVLLERKRAGRNVKIYYHFEGKVVTDEAMGAREKY